MHYDRNANRRAGGHFRELGAGHPKRWDVSTTLNTLNSPNTEQVSEERGNVSFISECGEAGGPAHAGLQQFVFYFLHEHN